MRFIPRFLKAMQRRFSALACPALSSPVHLYLASGRNSASCNRTAFWEDSCAGFLVNVTLENGEPEKIKTPVSYVCFRSVNLFSWIFFFCPILATSAITGHLTGIMKMHENTNRDVTKHTGQKYFNINMFSLP